MEERASPFVSVIIPVLNEERVIRECLTSLVELDYPPERWEILLVDNGSTDRTAEIINSFPVRYLREERRGPSSARNKGIEACKGEILAFTDADCIVSRGWLREIVRAFGEERVGGVAGEIIAYLPKTPAELHAAKVRHLSPQTYLFRSLLPFAVFANLAFRRDVFEKIGLLDEDLISGESTDFCTRFFRETDLELKFMPKALVFHRNRKTTWKFFKQQWGYGRGHAQLYIKYRHEIPWDWKKSILANRELAGAAWAFIKSVLRYGFKSDREDFYFYYFEFLKKLAERLGFIRQSLGQGYLYF